MNITLLSKFLKSTHCLTLIAVVTLTFCAFLMDYSKLSFWQTVFQIFLSIACVGCVWSLRSLLRKAYIHSTVVSSIILAFLTVFFLSSYLNMYTEITFILTSSFLSLWSAYQLLQIVFFNDTTYQVEDKKQFPEYQCIAISPFAEEYDFAQNKRETFDFEFDLLTLHYKNSYASNGLLHMGKDTCDFFKVISYLKETDREINDLSNDDFKLISMIFI